MGNSYRPRARLRLAVPQFGSTRAQAIQMRDAHALTLEAHVLSAQLERNDHHNADVLTVTAAWSDVGVDVRTVHNATCAFWLADGDPDIDNSQPLFVGICVDAKRTAGDSGQTVELKFHDYSALWIASKPYPVTDLPSFGDTLESAFAKIKKSTGYYEVGEDRIISTVDAMTLEIRDPALASRTLGGVVSGRLIRLGAFPLAEGAHSSWDVWTQIVASAAALSWVEGDRVILTSATEHYKTAGAPPAMIWGSNILSIEERLRPEVTQRGIAVQGWDPLSGHIIEAYYPPVGDPRLKRKRPKASPPDMPIASQYDFYQRLDVSNLAALERIAQNAWEERSRQEISGHLTTAEMRVDGVNLLDLRTGDQITVKIDQDTEMLRALDTNARIVRLVTNGYSRETAELIAANLDALASIDAGMHVTRMTVDYSDNTFEIGIDYHNRIVTTD